MTVSTPVILSCISADGSRRYSVTIEILHPFLFLQFPRMMLTIGFSLRLPRIISLKSAKSYWIRSLPTFYSCSPPRDPALRPWTQYMRIIPTTRITTQYKYFASGFLAFIALYWSLTTGTGAVYSFDPVGSYERETCRAAGAAQSLVQPFLDNQVRICYPTHTIICTLASSMLLRLLFISIPRITPSLPRVQLSQSPDIFVFP